MSFWGSLYVAVAEIGRQSPVRRGTLRGAALSTTSGDFERQAEIPRGAGSQLNTDGREAEAGNGQWIAFYNSGPALPGAGQPYADGGMARRGHRARRHGCGHDAAFGQRSRVAHIPIATISFMHQREMKV
jgi:hypothetical protein